MKNIIIRTGCVQKNYKIGAGISILLFMKYRFGFGYVFQKVKPMFLWKAIRIDSYTGFYVMNYQVNLIRIKNFAIGFSFSVPYEGQTFGDF